MKDVSDDKAQLPFIMLLNTTVGRIACTSEMWNPGGTINLAGHNQLGTVLRGRTQRLWASHGLFATARTHTTDVMTRGWHTWRIKQLRRRHLCGRLCCPKISPGIFYFLSSPPPFVCNKRWLLSVVLYVATGQSLEASLMLVIHALSGGGWEDEF